MELPYIIVNATIDILKDPKKNNDDEYLGAKLMNIKNAETEEELTNTNFDFTTKDPIDEENVKFSAPKVMIEDKYTETIDKKPTKDNDNDAETSFLLQNMDNSKSSSKDASYKDDDEYLGAKLMKIKNAETEEELTNTNFDFTTKDPINDEYVKFLAPKTMIEDKYTEIIDKKSTKEAEFLVPQYVMSRGV
ncbi:hypothetical protein RR48_01860 [Papilio machaon]|uniref:Uncharacterized protein n=1 Tax=Papilio machaon TaxID=76193 RepID=A0A0N1I9E9_PAPMA|nr:hypothetical protein RR48_01860 [Papilio machaon]